MMLQFPAHVYGRIQTSIWRITEVGIRSERRVRKKRLGIYSYSLLRKRRDRVPERYQGLIAALLVEPTSLIYIIE
jgi:hypothetical protein